MLYFLYIKQSLFMEQRVYSCEVENFNLDWRKIRAIFAVNCDGIHNSVIT